MTDSPARTHSQIDGQGRVLIPAELRRALGLEPGAPVTITLVGCELRIMTIDEGIRRAQDLVRKYIPAGRMLSDELIADRRAEVAKDLADD